MTDDELWAMWATPGIATRQMVRMLYEKGREDALRESAAPEREKGSGEAGNMSLSELVRRVKRGEKWQLADAAPSLKGSDSGYAEAFYKIAKLLDIPAMPISPKEAFEAVMLPKLKALLPTISEPWRFDPYTGFEIPEPFDQRAQGKAQLASLKGSGESDGLGPLYSADQVLKMILVDLTDCYGEISSEWKPADFLREQTIGAMFAWSQR